MQVPVFNLDGATVREIEVRDDVFGVPFNEPLVHQAMVRQRADSRMGLADTKTRVEVAGSTKKLYAQKHTGRARSGSIKSPLRKGGGIIFGPHPRSYRQAMPKKMRQLALRCLLSTKVSEGGLHIIDRLELPEAKTKAMATILGALKCTGGVLIATLQPDTNMVAAARNLPGVKTVSVGALSVVDLLNYKDLIATEDAIRKAEELWGKKAATEKAG
jgi:large subunit ribosomal protein L4